MATVELYSTCYAADCSPVEGAEVFLQQVTEGNQRIYDSEVRQATSDQDGRVTFEAWADGSTYRVRRGKGVWSAPFTPTPDENGQFLLPGLLGR